ncbi:Inhibitory regulator protein BUD2/CLA2 [Wickerhamomyces ciferrii]|uniref:Inhibitory regulator protein BUD2/CLA2 n=1 Tax=Wickerhamomyces ciferrii (strain ATCC 14091 / BCRC 22168 / CBS 111 / JCM 3599 / NBRC 0793 / NRRL Y-1031 F-60-10) TaxID=1206466 RepID=K0KJE4_WICCF|nr:Inhibitory regulator protein BUD2/CLA2 [Wickerhamomyces ciferrii]CCH41223.1 Inhibitory regulator protein BUD2/CLA2 [Wickerhamomyces ciferrii]
MSYGQTLDSRSIRSAIKESQGEFREHIDWSISGEKYETNTIKITNHGELLVLQTSEKLIRSLHSCSIQIVDSVLVVQSYNLKAKLYLRPTDRPTFIKLFASLLFWQSLRPRGIVNKRLSLPYETSQGTLSENLLVCSCKIFGQIPKNKNVEVLEGPSVPLFPDTNEGWFTAMVVLKSNGILELLGESDGSLLYSIDIKLLSRSEIREIHTSIFESSNYLFVGVIGPLRNETKFIKNSTRDLIPSISKENLKVSRIILEFPYRIDVEDWLVALSAFAKREYVGLDSSNLLRVPRNVSIGILEASLNEHLSEISGEFSKVYAEIHVWNTPWVRTSIIESSKNPFFRENFEFEIPFTTTKFHVVLKRALGTRYYLDDQILGYSTIDIATLNDETFNQETRIPLYLNNIQVGQFCVTINNEKNYILPPDNFNNFEQMMLNLDPKKLLRYVLKKQSGSNLEPISITLLDIFQSLQKENEWFSALIDEEVNKTSLGKTTMNDTSQLYNSLFRGNSILTKSLEIYNLRVGQEYLEKVVGKVITKIISNNRSTEIDPMRVNEPDESLKSDILEHNMELLLQYSEEIWTRIYNTSNDLPQQIKQQLIQLRKKIEMYTNDLGITLNCITGFLFLRFFCPVILNPKLFFLTKDHQTGEIKRTLTLISKILLTFSNRVLFGAKEPFMMGMNDLFIKKHESELIDYLDKVTGKKLDFTGKHLKLSSSIERTDIVLTSKTLLKELPTVPYLIDKYLRLDQLVDKLSTEFLDPKFIDDYAENDQEVEEDPESSQAELYKIGSLEFEKLVIKSDQEQSKDSQDFEFGSEEFIKNLLHTNESETIFNYMNSNSSLKDLIIEADRLSAKKSRLAAKLSSSETASDIDGLDSFIDDLLSTTIIDDQKSIHKTERGISGAKYLSSNSSYNVLRLKFLSEADSAPSIAPSARRFSKMIRSASINTMSSFGTITNENGEFVRLDSPKKSGFRKWLRKDK